MDGDEEGRLKGDPTTAGRRRPFAQQLREAGVIAVVRTPDSLWVPHLAEALVRGGVRAIELTTTIPGWLTCLDEMRRMAAAGSVLSEALWGVGSLMHLNQVDAAIEAGAEFLVSPLGGCRDMPEGQMIERAHEVGAPVLLGAMTPTECQRVTDAGADFVKLFPADRLGPEFVRSIMGPMPHLRLIPTGGVTLENLGAWRRAGCVAVGAGSQLIRPEHYAARDADGITREAAKWIAAWRSAGT